MSNPYGLSDEAWEDAREEFLEPKVRTSNCGPERLCGSPDCRSCQGTNARAFVIAEAEPEDEKTFDPPPRPA